MSHLRPTLPAEVVGLVPCAGWATRLEGLRGSKEVLEAWVPPGAVTPQPVCSCLLRAFARAGIRTAHLVLRSGKWDIPERLGDGGSVGLGLSYLITESPHGPAYTLDQAWPFLRDAVTVVGFPDILFPDPDPFTPMLARLQATGADVVLGLFPVLDAQPCDTVELDPEGRVTDLTPKPGTSEAGHSWALAAWTPRFGRYLHEALAEHPPPPPGTDRPIGQVLRQALGEGYRIEGVPVSSEPFLDVGTPEGLERARTRYPAPGR